MTALLRGLLMSDGPPTEDRAVSTILDYIALACIFGFVEAVMSGRPWAGGGALAAALIFHIVGIKWLKIKPKIGPRFTSWLDRIAHNSSYRRAVVGLLLGSVVMYAMVYMHTLRSDLDTYAMPRTIAEKQAESLRKYLLGYEQYAVTVTLKANPDDHEAVEYASQIVNAFVGSGWNTSLDTSDSAPTLKTFNDGLYLHVVGANAGPPDPKHNPQLILREAFEAANIAANVTTLGAGDYKVFLLVGRRPIKLEGEETMLFKLGRWIEQLGQ
jgi:hypothetical protein